MLWEELDGDQFPRAIAEAGGVCLLPLGCMERHAHHLPVGTDMIVCREICRRAAQVEPAIVFPDFIFTQINEARHYPGAVALDPDLVLRLLDNVCREIARNGMPKIILANGHGGNDGLIQYFSQVQLASKRDYVVYVADFVHGLRLASEDEAAVRAQWETTIDGHAGESETSAMLAVRPDLVHLENLGDPAEGMPRDHLKELRSNGLFTAIWWYADYPTHVSGDGHKGSAEKGTRELDAQVRALVRAIQLVKNDQTAKRLQDEFFDSCG